MRLLRFVDNCRIVSVESESTAMAFLSITVALCRSRVGARLWCFCRYLSHYVGRGGERGFGVFVVICRIMSDEGESEALVFLSVFVVLCRTRGRARLWCFCRYLSHCVGRGGARLWRFVDICRIMSDEGESAAMAFLSITVAL